VSVSFDKIDGDAYSVLMGRPPLNVKETKVRLSLEARERIKALVGTYGVAAFIREAVEHELERRERQAAGKGEPHSPPEGR
jgi:hypothetical protein